MGREVRRVPPDYTHPTDRRYSRPASLFYGAGGRYEAKAREWLANANKWAAGERPDYAGDDAPEFFWDWDGGPPVAEDYMLVGVPDAACTHLQLFETTSEGSPISPVFATLEALAAWAADHATTFADYHATREEWLRMLSPGGVVTTEIAPGIVAI
jgi:hypothetical protein